MAKTETQRAKDRAWESFSKYIRARDPKCVTCGADTTQAGHYWHNVLDFDEKNIHGQCTRCNHFLSGNLAVYSSYLIKKYGIKEYKALEQRKYKALAGEKRTAEELRAIAQEYKQKLLDLQSGGIHGV